MDHSSDSPSRAVESVLSIHLNVSNTK
jgi:hypothetical protein